MVLLYISDLPINIQNAKPVMFAADISVLISDSDPRVLEIKIGTLVAELVNPV
jgi:hypothetical protein